MLCFLEGCGDRQAYEALLTEEDQTFHDIYLVYTSKPLLPHVDKIKEMCQSNGWKFTTPYDGKADVRLMQSVEEAILTCSYVVLLITEDDCSIKSGKYNMPVEMAFSVESGKIGGKVIPIRCCDKDSLPLQLGCLVGSTIDDDDLEERMIKTIDKEIRKKREAHAVSFCVRCM